jgi:hypothetical protein
MSFKDFLGKLFSPLKRAISALKGLRDPKVRERVLEEAEFVHALMEYALPAAELAAKLTPSPTDDKLVAALNAMGRSAGSILNEPDKNVRDGLFLALAAELTRQYLALAVKAAGYVTIGGVRVTVPEEISNSAIRAAVDYVFHVVLKTQASAPEA